MRKPLAIALLLIGGAALKIALSVVSAVKDGKIMRTANEKTGGDTA